MKKLILCFLLSIVSLSAYALPEPIDQVICLGEPKTLADSDDILCFNLDTHTVYPDGTSQNAISGYLYSRRGDFTPISGSMITGVDTDGTASYFISYHGVVLAKAAVPPGATALPEYDIQGNYILNISKMGTYAPASELRFNSSYVVGQGYRQDWLSNAWLFSNCATGTLSAYNACQDIHTNMTPFSGIVRYSPSALPFNKPAVGGYQSAYYQVPLNYYSTAWYYQYPN